MKGDTEVEDGKQQWKVSDDDITTPVSWVTDQVTQSNPEPYCEMITWVIMWIQSVLCCLNHKEIISLR